MLILSFNRNAFIYFLCRRDSAFNFGWFFMFYMVSIYAVSRLFCFVIMLYVLRIEECLIIARILTFNFICLQLHICFCIFSAIAPPIVFKGKSLTYVFDYLYMNCVQVADFFVYDSINALIISFSFLLTHYLMFFTF